MAFKDSSFYFIASLNLRYLDLRESRVGEEVAAGAARDGRGNLSPSRNEFSHIGLSVIAPVAPRVEAPRMSSSLLIPTSHVGIPR